ncbi:MAG TPA: hypothetical protein VI306_11550 [Pyrinomonadaceae bacterium]
MRLTMKARQEVIRVTAGQYRGAGKKQKGQLVDQFIATTGYSRWYVRLVLRQAGRRIQTDPQTILLALRKKAARKRQRPSKYDDKVQLALVKLWRILDHICGKRLQPNPGGIDSQTGAPQ